MDKKIYITADSPCDISSMDKEKFGIDELIPLHIVLGDDVYDDGYTVNVDEMLRFYDETSQLPKTSAVSIEEYRNAFLKYQKEDCELIHLSLSSKLSSTHYNALLAAKEFDNIHVVDTNALSLSIAIFALEGHEMIKNGIAGIKIYDALNHLVPKVKTAFILDSLEFLHKGGRCSGVAALGANVLKIKPCIVMENGALSLGKKYRGKLDVCQMQYIRDRFENSGENLDKKCVFIGYTSGMDTKQLEQIQNEVKKYGFKEIYTLQVGCTITAHCGRNTFAVFFKEK